MVVEPELQRYPGFGQLESHAVCGRETFSISAIKLPERDNCKGKRQKVKEKS